MRSEMTAFGAAALLAEAQGATLQIGEEQPRRVEPAGDGQAWRERFTEARKRSQGWRRD